MKGKTGKRLMSWLLAMVMLLGAAIVPVSASAKENAFVQERDGIPWDKVL